MTPRLLLGGMLMACVLTTGCSVLRVSTSEDAAGPVAVGVSDGSPETANAGGTAIPEEWKRVDVELGDKCPISVEFALDPRWTDGGGVSGYRLYANGDERLINIDCYAWGGDGPESVTDEAKRVVFDDPGSSVIAERDGETPGGVFWTVKGVLGPSSVRAVGDTESVLYKTVAGIRDEGRLFKVSVEMAATKEDAEAAAAYVLMQSSVRFGGHSFPLPAGMT